MARYVVLRSIETLGGMTYEVRAFNNILEAKRYAETRGGVLIPASDIEEVCRKLRGAV